MDTKVLLLASRLSPKGSKVLKGIGVTLYTQAMADLGFKPWDPATTEMIVDEFRQDLISMRDAFNDGMNSERFVNEILDGKPTH